MRSNGWASKREEIKQADGVSPGKHITDSLANQSVFYFFLIS
jgi:hypothetical protein